MRHLFSLLVSLVLAPLIWLGIGIGGNRILAGRTGGNTPDKPDLFLVLVGLGALLAAGLLYAILVLARLSPLGPVLVGLIYMGATFWALLAYRSFLDVVPTDLGNLKGVGEVPAGGVAAVLAVPLLLTLFSPRRWRRRERGTEQPAGAVAYSGPTSPAAPYQPPQPYQPYQPQPAAYIPQPPSHEEPVPPANFSTDVTRPLHAPVDEDTTRSLYGTPPPPAAYPPPGHAGSTPSPTDPDATRRF